MTEDEILGDPELVLEACIDAWMQKVEGLYFDASDNSRLAVGHPFPFSARKLRQNAALWRDDARRIVRAVKALEAME